LFALAAIALFCIPAWAGGQADQQQQQQQIDTPLDFPPDIVPHDAEQAIAYQTLQFIAMAPDMFPRIDSSTSAHPLAMHVACRVLGEVCGWDFRFTTNTARNEYKTLLPVHHADAMMSPEPATPGNAVARILDIWPSGTNGSYMNLIDNKADVIITARAPSDDELEYAKDKNITLDARPVAWDAFVFIVNKDNPVKALTTQQIRDIYTDKITNWSAVNGPDAPINAYTRNDNSGSQELMQKMVMKDLDMAKEYSRHRDLMSFGMMGPVNQLWHDPAGLAYSVYFFEQFMAPNDNLSLVAVDGVLPAYDAIQSGAYPYAAEVYVVVREGDPADSAAVALRDWLLSEEGQMVVGESGYVPLNKE
jgi:phosphate transport system substrate-binding protein